MSKKLSESIVQDTMKTNGIEVAPGNKGTIKNSGLAEDTKNLRGFVLLLRAAKYHQDELQDMDDLYDLMDRLSVDEDECPEDFTPEEVTELTEYLDTIPQEDINRCWDEVHGFDLGEKKINEDLKEDIQMDPEGVVLELIVPEDSGLDLTNPGSEVMEEPVQQEEPVVELAKYLISAEASIRVLHHNLVGKNWFGDHEKLDEYGKYIGDMEDDVIEQLILLGGIEPSVEEAITSYPTIEIKSRNNKESFEILKGLFDTIREMIENAKGAIPADMVSKFEEYQNYLRKESDYKIVRDLQENYVLVSNQVIKNRLKLESKIEDVKKDAEAECIKRGCDTYVYQLGEDIFYADEKPTDTRLINKGILTLGKYRIGVSEGKPVATWFEESKVTSTNKKSLNELAESLQDDKTFEDPHESEAVRDIEGKANYNKKNANVDLGGPLKDIPHDTEIGKNPEEINKAANYNKEINTENQPIVNDIHKEFKHTAMDEIKSKATYNHKELNVAGTPEGKNVEVTIVGEGKEPEVEDEIGLMSLEAYKAKHKEEIDLCYANTYGKEKVKELYDSLAEYMYSTSLTGNINNKKDYKSMNDKINETEIAGHKIEIVDNAPDGHEENQPKK